MNKKTELLSPAGSPTALRAAVEGGADAVYMGMSAFNARIYAKNFTTEELAESIRLAHAYGTKVYIAMNTMVYDRELTDFLRAAEQAYLCGADALIVADLGGADAIRARIPIELHASTQMAGHNVNAARLLAERGFSRMVAARELSAENLKTLVTTSPIETEVFVHGALCVSHSGQCLFSSIVGGRSGNRGECAQPCRLPYRAGKGQNQYPLSLKDLSLAEHLTDLCQMGVASLKIEGRMKSPEYVRDVTRIWRRLLDESRNATKDEMVELAEIFSRGGFTDGYYTGRIDRKMLGIRTENDKQSSRERAPFSQIERKIPITLSATVRANEPMSLTVLPQGVTVHGQTPEAARNAPIDTDTVSRSLSKWGGTPYAVKDLAIDLDEGLMVPISALNALRRKALDALMPQTERSERDFLTVPTTQKSTPKARTRPSRSAVFYRPDEMPREAMSYFDICYLPIEAYEGQTNGVLLPPVITDGECAHMLDLLKRAEDLGAKHVLIGNLGHLSLAKQTGLTVHGDLRLNLANQQTHRALKELGFADLILSPELTLAQMRDFDGARAIVYGRLPLMITEKCVGRELGSCSQCESGKTTLVDRRSVSFPVLRAPEHRSLIFNSVPTYMADRAADLEKIALGGHHFLFTSESMREISAILRAYERKEAPSTPVRRIR